MKTSTLLALALLAGACGCAKASAPHGAIYRFTYGKKGPARLMVDGQWGVVFPKHLKSHVLEKEIPAWDFAGVKRAARNGYFRRFAAGGA